MIFVVLPAYNEEPNIQPLMAALAELGQSVPDLKPIVVDDGSADRTADFARQYGAELGVEVIVHEKNKGLGEAVKTGLRHVCEVGAADDIVVFLDADNSHNPDHIKGMVKLIHKGADVVIASRYEPGGKEIGLTRFRSVGSRMVSLALASVFRVEGAKDYTCGYRAYTVAVIRKGFEQYGDALISESSFVCMAELLVKLFSVGARVDEYPLVLRYDLKQGDSKMNIPKTLRRYAHFVLTQTSRVWRVRRQTEASVRSRAAT
jgi:dolichol-phosphate mannosyltransferase